MMIWQNHAVAYRALSLLERSPGREASIPGMYSISHSRLLERSSRLSDELGGGSITGTTDYRNTGRRCDLPIFRLMLYPLQTDDRFSLESDLFFSGQRPAFVNNVQFVGIPCWRCGARQRLVKKPPALFELTFARSIVKWKCLQFLYPTLDEETKVFQLMARAYGAF